MILTVISWSPSVITHKSRAAWDDCASHVPHRSDPMAHFCGRSFVLDSFLSSWSQYSVVKVARNEWKLFSRPGTFSVLSFLCRGIRNELLNPFLMWTTAFIPSQMYQSINRIGQKILYTDCSKQTLKDRPEYWSWGSWRPAVDVSSVIHLWKKLQVLILLHTARLTLSRDSSSGPRNWWKEDLFTDLHISYRTRSFQRK